MNIFLKVLLFTEDYQNNQKLMNNLIEFLRNSNNIEILTSSLLLLKNFSSDILLSTTFIDLLLNLLKKFYKNSLICVTIFELLKGNSKSIDLYLKTLIYYNDNDILNTISLTFTNSIF